MPSIAQRPSYNTWRSGRLLVWPASALAGFGLAGFGPAGFRSGQLLVWLVSVWPASIWLAFGLGDSKKDIYI